VLYCQHYMPALRTWQHKCIIGRAIWKEPSRKLKVVDLKVLTLRASTTASEPVDPAQMEQTSAISPWSGLGAPGVCGSLFGPNLFDLLELMRPANPIGGSAPPGSGMGDMAKPRQPSGNSSATPASQIAFLADAVFASELGTRYAHRRQGSRALSRPTLACLGVVPTTPSNRALNVAPLGSLSPQIN
jgi:hypothetical protein